MLLWVDLETTGLVPETDAVLEVAAVVTRDDLTEVARGSWVCGYPLAEQLAGLPANWQDDAWIRHMVRTWSGLDPVVIEMHRAGGLWAECAGTTREVDVLDRCLTNFIVTNCREWVESPDGPEPLHCPTQLAGSTISFDRAFMRRHLPASHALLHYRNLDVTTLNEVARRFWPAVHEGRPRGEKRHRAMEDVLESLEVCRYYVSKLGPVTP